MQIHGWNWTGVKSRIADVVIMVLVALWLLMLAAGVAFAQNPSVIVLEGTVVPFASCTVQRNGANTAWECAAPAGAVQPLTDSAALMANAVDATKVLAFQLSGISTATTRTWTIPDANITFPTTIASLGANTFTGLQTLNAGIAATTGTFSSTLGVTGAFSGTTGTFSSTLGVTGVTTLAAMTATTGSYSSTLSVSGVASMLAGIEVGNATDTTLSRASAGVLAVEGVELVRVSTAPVLSFTNMTDALPAVSGAALTSLNASNLASGTLPGARFPATLPAASGVNLTALNATNLASGTVADARLSSNVNLLDAAQTVSGAKTHTGNLIGNYSSGNWWNEASGSQIQMIDSDNNGTEECFYWRHNASAAGGTQLASLCESGHFALNTAGRLYLDGGSSSYLIGSSTQLEFYTGSAQAMILNTSLIEVPRAYDSTSGSAANVVVIAGGQLLRSTSSLRYKSDVQTFSGGLADLLRLQPISFISNTDPAGPRHLGFTAEALDAAGMHNVVVYDDQGRPDAIQYDRLTTYLVNAIKELTTEIDALKKTAGLSASVRRASTPDTASRDRAIAREQSAKATRDEREGKRTMRDMLETCEANNTIIVQQGGKPVSCATTAAEKQELAAMRKERTQADAETKQREAAQCAKRNTRIVAAGGTPIACGSPAPDTRKERQ